MSEAFIGEIKTYGFSFAPRNFALANGATLSISQNSALFSLLGTTYGGNGQTTFQLPNLGGRYVMGQGQSAGTSQYVIGQVAGNENVTILQSQMPMHTHIAATTVTPNSSGLTAATTITAITAPTARVPNPTGNLLTSGVTGGAAPNPPLLGYTAFANGTAATMAPEMATTTLSGSVTATAATTVQTAGGSQPINVQSPYLIINYCIATVGIFPSRN
jgi:microcystin-dependent protein